VVPHSFEPSEPQPVERRNAQNYPFTRFDTAAHSLYYFTESKKEGVMVQNKLIAAAILFLTLLFSGMAQQNPDMQLIILGTGYPFPSPERAGPSCAIAVGGKLFIVDAGRGIGMRLAKAGNPWRSIEAAFLTHLHSDHIDGLPDLFHSTWEFGRGTPFQLYGPKGTQAVADGILQFYGPDIQIRRDLTEKLSPQGAKINVHEIQEGVVYEKPGEVKVTAFLVEHPQVEPSFGYRFDTGKHSIVITGDMRPNPNLIRFASGADILVHEAYLGGTGASSSAEPKRWSIHDYHSSAKEAGEAAEKAKVKVLVLTHLIPASATEQDFMDEAKKAFSGKIIVGRDLMVIKPSD
jgi:ribonuclease Z